MFAVPGWSVSTAELKLQKEQQAPTPHASSARNAISDNPPKSNKRKRNNALEDKVTKANVDEMWKKHIEGLKSGGNKAKSLKPKKKKKGEANSGGLGNGAAKIIGQVSGPGFGGDEQSRSTKHNSKKGGHGDSHVESPRKKQKQSAPANTSKNGGKHTSTSPVALPAAAPEPPNLTPLQKAMRDKLVSARFRHLNETLYTTPSSKALELFTASPELFAEYHAGFSRQVKESWPSNPVDDYIRAVKARGPIRPPAKGSKRNEKPGQLVALPRRPSGICTIADLGCGDAQFSRALTPLSKKMKLKILSYDLHEGDPLITKADISALPLEDGTVDLTIFCLSLMGTNWVSFVEEAWRVLRGDGKGECWVSEVKSRFGKVTRKNKPNPKPAIGSKNKAKKKLKETDDDEGDIGNEIFAEDVRANQNMDDETDISAFVEVFRTRGFILKPQTLDKSNKMFVKMEFVKHGVPTRGKWAGTGGVDKGFKKRFLEPEDNGLTPEEESQVLKPCVYKIR
ncbi:conserved hypothetical protein [Uncinocarpus reesii 1704]|uniref:Ribosomal RNA-processing protein 8 n=1 Tax=Uncinocarpus reesii (strain UAMH 1704) TaxID=336963 RepID=C4JFV1_UNCRE|nr:uncharacterized protein UREG_02435 [Uncinocarpus reesii 1704]EEP77586.1 conserved hypothetical protein [Uncinocarpus reesii 1704]